MKLYGSLRSRASRVMWLLEELGVPYEHDPVEPRSEAARSDPYLRLNPAGKVPTLQIDNFVVTESLAINLWLAQRNGPPFWPADPLQQAHVLQWTLWQSAELEPVTSGIGKAMRTGAPDAERIVAENLAAVAALLALVEVQLNRSMHLAGDAFTVADLNLASLLMYAPPFSIDLSPFPKICAWLALTTARPAHRKLFVA